jgi:hypothetical protein
LDLILRDEEAKKNEEAKKFFSQILLGEREF